MTAIVFDAFGTLFNVTDGGSARTIINHIKACGKSIDENKFSEEWKAYYKTHTTGACGFMTERDIFISRIQMYYDRYGVDRSAEQDADSLLAGALERKAYPEVKWVIDKLKEKYQVFIGSNTDNNVLESVIRKNGIMVHKIYTSENLKCYKPNPLFYKRILDDNGLSPQEVMFVGDSISDDVIGPKTVGMKTTWIDRNGIGGDFGQDFTISDLRKLL